MLTLETTRNCKQCGKEFSKPVNCSRKEWTEKRKTCSPSCSSKIRGVAHLCRFSFKKGIQNNPTGGFAKGNIPHNYKGDSATYAAKHLWISYHYGKASECESSKCSGKSTKYHWSNISGEYKRDRADWQQLCVSCHKVYDLKKGHSMKDVKRTVRGQRPKAKGSIPGKVRLHPHTAKALNAVAVKSGTGKKGPSTNNGLSGKDSRY